MVIHPTYPHYPHSAVYILGISLFAPAPGFAYTTTLHYLTYYLSDIYGLYIKQLIIDPSEQQQKWGKVVRVGESGEDCVYL
ncbi:hypothetical protein GCM10023188_13450 [Pontibacter saemangeumensis]|uniref:Uncharacterized protein n=1 Tax=Pontibacter saemangeumensis TaxID=1084525 RepID=A0ABP8LI18_9BACT